MNDIKAPITENLLNTITEGMSATETFFCIDVLDGQIKRAHAAAAATALSQLLPKIVEITWDATAEMGDEGQTYSNYSGACFVREDGIKVSIPDSDASDDLVDFLIRSQNDQDQYDEAAQALGLIAEGKDAARHGELEPHDQVIALLAEFAGTTREQMQMAFDIAWRAIYAFPADEASTSLNLRAAPPPQAANLH